ncbi:hypothetical protein GCM10011502_02000 [Oceanisphaera marina]|uniref:Entericidin n=1 Tax=Oceanisphaera marina TaxID=2017550 RepID=A0ABQ1IBY2_9GAMM|nr:hypothetical protein GCM10011502_02000 [Oceanisphaera marina]
MSRLYLRQHGSERIGWLSLGSAIESILELFIHRKKDEIMIKKIMAVLMVVGLFGGLAGCNTVAGAGKDVQRGGEAVEDAARDVQY